MGAISASDGTFNFRVWESKRKFFFTIGLIGLFLFTVTALRRQDHVRALKYFLPDGQHALSSNNLKDLGNMTLGFEKVYVINMPDRTDKLDAMRLAASLSGFEFDVIEGISGADVSDKALPGSFGNSPSVNGSIGSWRAHMNFAEAIVENQFSTAFVMEDDADWDVAFRSQLEAFALASQLLGNNTATGHRAHSPYGDDWDLLWLGHCGNQATPGDNRRVLIENDPTVTPVTRRHNEVEVPDMTSYDNTTRIVYPSNGGVCSYAYALTYRGAQKVLYHLSMMSFGKPFDWGLHDMCDQQGRGFKCISVFPQIMDVYRSAGSKSKDSDINDGEEELRSQPIAVNIVHSTKLNIPHLIDGDLNKVESQWPGEVPELTGPVRVILEEEME